ncbi:response regulator transcription factor [Patescibacteria group bacterium]|nr:response regulator transcription factor [Patescibacteria group bacterium]
MRLLFIDSTNSLEELQNDVEENYIVDKACSGDEGIFMFQVNDYDAVVIDYCLSDIKSEETCEAARASGVKTPLLVLTNQDDPKGRADLLDAGADVCLSKPVNSEELEANIRALVRRNRSSDLSSRIQSGEFELDMRNRQVKVKGCLVPLRRKEYELLEYLAINAGRIVSKEEILEHVWEGGIFVFSNTVEVHIRNLRDKIEKVSKTVLIETVRGFGYRIKK